MKKTNIEKKIYYCVNILILVAVLAIMIMTIVGHGKIDLNISKSIGNGASYFGIIFAIIGEMPSYILIPVSLIIVFFNIKDKTESMIVQIILLVLVFLSYLMWFMTAELFEILVAKGTLSTNGHLTISLILAVVCAVVTLLCASKIDKNTMKKLYKFAIFTLVLILITFLISRIMKYLVARPRFRNMIKNNDYSVFQPWYHMSGFQGLRHDNTSYPSGHTVSATSIVVIAVLPEIFTKLKKYKPYFYLGSFIFILLTAISRIVNNAHFLSDVTAAAALTYGCYLLLYRSFFHSGEFYKGQINADNEKVN